jgi:molybdopterin-containing oxidoreductase family iron-sulfur binding subunit
LRRDLWRSLSERDGADARDTRVREFARGADESPDAVARRDFLRFVGASAALAGATACSRAQRETLSPYVVEPSQAVPGNPLYFATSLVSEGYATGLVVESHEGRPTKVEGNPDHPASLGATSAIHQAAVLGLYDPHRARGVTHGGEARSWPSLVETLATRADGERVSLLLEPTSSPLAAEQVARLRSRFPAIDVRWHVPLAPRAAWEGARIALGEVLETRVDLRMADVIVALDSDFLMEGPAALRLARDFAARRRLGSASAAMSRFYAVEPVLSVTGMSADHRLRTRACDVLAVAASLAIELAALGVPVPTDLAPPLNPWSARVAGHVAWIRAVARDLVAHRSRSALLVGGTQPAALHALVHALNAALGNVGTTITYARSPILDAGSEAFDLAPLLRDLDDGKIGTLVVAGGNPVYGASGDLDLARRVARARRSFYLGPYVDETARACQWFAPQAHFLEAWGDGRAFDGTISLSQPLAARAFAGHTTSELLSILLGEPTTAHDQLVSHWRRARADSETSWNAWLEKGMIPGTAFPALAPPALQQAAVRDAIARLPLPPASPLELTVRPDARLRDGAHSNNTWLQEMPDPVTRQAWGNAALLSEATATRLAVTDGDVLQLEVAGRSIRAPALVVPGHADDTIALALGYGRRGEGEENARDVGANANVLRRSTAPWFTQDLTVTRTSAREDLALEQEHSSLEGRDDSILLHRTLDEYRRAPDFATPSDKRPLALYDLKSGGARQWGMVIDLNACTGCGACVIACQAENNIPVVGKAGVAKGRAMHWLRIDRYFVGPPDAPRVLLEPMLCQHCEKAPCEYVCPVNATTHSEDGLNQMTYNRCVGTRFCSNNCPYKVRRFNWFNYHAGESRSEAAVHNPDVTVRARGVMEKCTYCVQRIREAEIRAEVTRHPIVDGDVVTACEQACPTRAITFGNIRDATSRVSQLRENERRFAVLNELGTVPRTRYLARVTNPNPELA